MQHWQDGQNQLGTSLFSTVLTVKIFNSQPNGFAGVGGRVKDYKVLYR